jgi:hypothetical protein
MACEVQKTLKIYLLHVVKPKKVGIVKPILTERAFRSVNKQLLTKSRDA